MAEKLGAMDTAPARKKSAHTRAGLDIGSDSVKIVELTDDPSRPALVGCAMKRPASASKEALIDAVKAAAQEAAITAKMVTIAVAGPPVTVRFISMPKMSTDDLKGALRFEAEKFIPFTINDCVVDFQVLRKVEAENRLEILLVAAKKAYIEERVRTVEAAGFSVRAVDVDSFAVANAFLRNVTIPSPDETAAVVHIGAAATNVSIVRGGTIYFARDIALGGRDVDAALVKQLNLSAEAAAAIKIDPKDRLGEVVAAVKPAVVNLLDELRLSFSYYENQSGRDINMIYLSGGGAGLFGLAEHIEETFTLKPLSWDPFHFLETGAVSAPEAVRRSYAVAVGLALR